MATLFIITFAASLLAAFSLSYRSPHTRYRPWCRDWSLWHTGVHTEYAGSGRVRFVSFFRGAGYVVRLRSGRGWNGKPLNAPGWDPSIYIPGFTIYMRTHASSMHATRGKSVRFFRITRKPNQSIV